MSKANFIGTLAAVAPTLAAALGGPLAGMATKAIAEKLTGQTIDGPAMSEADLGNLVMGTSSGDLVKLKELDLAFKADLQRANVDLERVHASDRSSARRRASAMGDWTPSILGVLILSGFFGLVAYLIRFGMPAEGTEILLILFGALSTMTASVANYFFGSSVGSKSKGQTIAHLKSAG